MDNHSWWAQWAQWAVQSDLGGLKPPRSKQISEYLDECRPPSLRRRRPDDPDDDPDPASAATTAPAAKRAHTTPAETSTSTQPAARTQAGGTPSAHLAAEVLPDTIRWLIMNEVPLADWPLQPTWTPPSTLIYASTRPTERWLASTCWRPSCCHLARSPPSPRASDGTSARPPTRRTATGRPRHTSPTQRCTILGLRKASCGTATDCLRRMRTATAPPRGLSGTGAP